MFLDFSVPQFPYLKSRDDKKTYSYIYHQDKMIVSVWLKKMSDQEMLAINFNSFW